MNTATTAPDRVSQLIIRVSTGDRSAFDELYRLTSAKLFGICLRVLNDRAEAEEALQEIYVKVWTKADRFSVSELSPISWLAAIARNHAIDRIRLRRIRTTDLDDAVAVADDRPGPEAMTVLASEGARLAACMETLEADRAEAVRGAYLNGDSYVDLAERYGVPLNTMRTWLRRSLIKLRECLQG
jgi:RNA polymerase sigma-70 factor, ECF subfamily